MVPLVDYLLRCWHNSRYHALSLLDFGDINGLVNTVDIGIDLETLRYLIRALVHH